MWTTVVKFGQRYALVMGGGLGVLSLLISLLYAGRQAPPPSCDQWLAQHAPTAQQHVYAFFNNPAAHTSGDLDRAVICLIGSAQKTLDIAVYQADYRPYLEALRAARGRGVAIRFVTDNTYYNDPDYYAAFYQPLQEAGIAVHNDARSAQSHNKFMVIDGQRVWTASANWTERCTFTNANNGLLIYSPVVAQWYAAEFAELWRGRFGPSKKPIRGVVELPEGRLEVCFDPQPACQQAILQVVRAADHTLAIAAFSMTDQTLMADLQQAQQRSVGLRALFDKPDCRYGAYRYLKARSPTTVFTRQNLPPSYTLIHDKVIVVDANTASDPTVVTGSRNFSRNAATANDENVLIIHIPFVVTAYAQALENILSAAAVADNACANQN